MWHWQHYVDTCRVFHSTNQHTHWSTGVPLTNWKVHPLHLGEGLPPLPWGAHGRPVPANASGPPAPAFVRFEFWVDPQRRGLYEAHPPDTYLALHGWGKGVAFVNNFNLGWCAMVREPCHKWRVR